MFFQPLNPTAHTYEMWLFMKSKCMNCTCDTYEIHMWCNWLGLNHFEKSKRPPPPPPPVGGIYTVVRSKADVTTAELGDEYVMIGPYNESTVRLEVEVAEPESPITREVIDQMRTNGIKVGGTRKTRWVGPGRQGGWGQEVD